MGQVAGWRVAKLALCMMGFACSSPDASDQGGLPALGGVGGGGGSDAPPTAPSTAGSAGSNVSASHAGSGGVGGSSAAAGSGAAGAAGAAGTMTAPNEDPPDPEADCAAVLEEIATGSTPYPGGRWAVPEPAYDTVVETDVQIAMSDGVMLVGDVSYPADLATGRRASGEFPVILTQNPYGAAFGASSGEIFVTHAYIFASIDVRGTTRSGGEHDMISPR